jgi:hypothetical protein
MLPLHNITGHENTNAWEGEGSAPCAHENTPNAPPPEDSFNFINEDEGREPEPRKEPERPEERPEPEPEKGREPPPTEGEAPTYKTKLEGEALAVFEQVHKFFDSFGKVRNREKCEALFLQNVDQNEAGIAEFREAVSFYDRDEFGKKNKTKEDQEKEYETYLKTLDYFLDITKERNWTVWSRGRPQKQERKTA